MGIIRTILFYLTLDTRSMKRLRWCYAQLNVEDSLNMDNIDVYLNQRDIAKAIDGLSSCYLEIDDDRKSKGVKKVLAFPSQVGCLLMPRRVRAAEWGLRSTLMSSSSGGSLRTFSLAISNHFHNDWSTDGAVARLLYMWSMRG